MIGYVAALAVGYVLGTKAGRRRYEQIAGTYRAVTESPAAKAVITAGRRKIADSGVTGSGDGDVDADRRRNRGAESRRQRGRRAALADAPVDRRAGQHHAVLVVTGSVDAPLACRRRSAGRSSSPGTCRPPGCRTTRGTGREMPGRSGARTAEIVVAAMTGAATAAAKALRAITRRVVFEATKLPFTRGPRASTP